MNRKTYRKIAKHHGVSLAEVKQEMQVAITVAYTNQDRNLINIKAQKAVPHKREIPTPNELIDYATAEVRRRQKEK